jgi:hypothetical protein
MKEEDDTMGDREDPKRSRPLHRIDRRAFLGLTAGGLLGPGRLDTLAKAGSKTDGRDGYDWIDDIKHGTSYTLLKTVRRADLVFLSPPDEPGGALRVDFVDWGTYPDQEGVVLVPVVQPDPEWHVLGPARYSVSLWMGPRPRHAGPSAVIEFEFPTPVALYVHEDRIQQVILLTEAPG